MTNPADQQAYWDWEKKELAEADLASTIQAVLDDTNNCLQITVVAASAGAESIVQLLANDEALF